MKSFNSTIVGLLFVSLTVNLQAQFTNLEVLEHSEDITILTSLIHNKGDIIYVVTDNVTGRTSTQVKVLDQNNIPQTIDTDAAAYMSDSEYMYDSNGNLRIYLTQVADPGFDTHIWNIIEIGETPNGYVSNTIRHDLFFSLEVITSVGLDSTDRIYALTSYPRLLVFEEDSLQNEILLPASINSLIHTNTDGDVYFLESETDSIYNVTRNLELQPIAQVPFDINEIKNVGDDIWVLDDNNMVWALDSEFSTAPRLIFDRNFIQSLDQVSEMDSLVYILETDTDGFTLHQYDGTNVSEINVVNETLATSSKLAMIDDTTFLTSGQYLVEDITNQAFLRGYNTNQIFEPERVSVELEDFDLFYIKDTIISGGPGDLWWYGINYSVFNSGDKEVGQASVFTTDLVPAFPYININFEENATLNVLPEESIIVESNRLISQNHPGAAQAYLTGADYKFNTSVGPVLIDVTTSTSDHESTSALTVFPNPFTSHINLNDLNDEAVSLYNMEGQLILSGKANEIQNVDLSYLNEGIYLLYFDNNKQAVKLMKSK